jgi:hypothetical protein
MSLGTIYLCVLTVQDYRSMTVDSKYNYILWGVALSLFTHVTVSIWYTLSILAGLVFLNLYGKKLMFFGKGDFSAFTWLFLGLALINPFILAYYLGVLIALAFAYYGLRKYLFKNDKPIPFYPVIFGSWVLTLPFLFSML